MEQRPVVIIGAGPAGLTAAYQLLKRNVRPTVIEKTNQVGGLARTEIYMDYRFDIGGHRFFTHIDQVQRLWHQVLGEEFVKMDRLSRIYYRRRFFKYPLEIFDAFLKLGPAESFLMLLSYLRAQLRPHPVEETFEQWVVNRFGRRLYQTFFKTYTEKVWGLPCHEIQSDWAAQRIKGLSFVAILSKALFGTNGARSLIDEFHYPLRGSGDMWNRFGEALERHGEKIHFDGEVTRLRREGHSIRNISVKHREKTVEISGANFISSMPLAELIMRLDPRAPDEVTNAARGLSYRAFILVGLIIDRSSLFPDQWIYVHSPDVNVGRIQNFKQWSAAMVPDPDKTSLGMEYFCTVGDKIWRMPDDELVEMAKRELVHLGIAELGDVRDGVVFRHSHAYPVYDRGYDQHLLVIRCFLKKFDNLQTIGRSGLHQYNNQDHSVLTAMLAVENLFGANHDLWKLNERLEYIE